MTGVWSPTEANYFLWPLCPDQLLSLTQPPIQWVPRVLSLGVKNGRSMTLTTNPHLVPRSRMSMSYLFSPPCWLHGGSRIVLLCFTLYHLHRQYCIIWEMTGHEWMVTREGQEKKSTIQHMLRGTEENHKIIYLYLLSPLLAAWR
jgi:hypothetical protein